MVDPTSLQDPALSVNTRLSEQVNDAAVVRIGRVTHYDAANITVAISGSDTLINAAYLLNQYQPVLGDVVVVLKSGASWVVLGALSGIPSDNVVKSPSFEDGVVGSVPTNWTVYHQSGTDTAVVTTQKSSSVGFDIDGSRVMRVQLNPTIAAFGNSVDYVTSASIPVTPNETWAASAFAIATTATLTFWSVSAAVVLTWYASMGDAYPSTSAADSFVTDANMTGGPHWIRLRGLGGSSRGIIVPSTARAMRVALRSVIFGDPSNEVDLYWDRVVASKIFNADGTPA